MQRTPIIYDYECVECCCGKNLWDRWTPMLENPSCECYCHGNKENLDPLEALERSIINDEDEEIIRILMTINNSISCISNKAN